MKQLNLLLHLLVITEGKNCTILIWIIPFLTSRSGSCVTFNVSVVPNVFVRK